MKRREFITQTAYGLGAAWLGSKAAFPAKSPGRISATDTVTLGKTGIRTSRLAMGTGTVGVGHHSHQTALGIQGLSDLLWHGYALMDLAEVLRLAGRAQEAVPVVEEAVELFDRKGIVPAGEAAQALLAELEPA